MNFSLATLFSKFNCLVAQYALCSNAMRKWYCRAPVPNPEDKQDPGKRTSFTIYTFLNTVDINVT